jgi:O-antigen ligase/tetratricopeptide (TPR) repeat protein
VAVATLLTVPLVVFGGLPAAFLAWVPLAVTAAIILIWNSHWGLCFAAFAITPLGNVQHEFFGLTLNLPEVVILALVAKETIRFLLRKERFVPHMPIRALGLYLCGLLAAIGTGFAYRNGLVKVLQDFRQFAEFILLFCLVLQRVTTRQQAFQIALCYVFGATLTAIHGIVQHYTVIGIPATQVAYDLHAFKGIRSGSFYGATCLGGLMVLAVGPAAGLALASERRPVKLVMVACIGLCLAATVYTNTRAAWMGMMVSFAFIAVSIRPSAKTIAATTVGALVFAAAMAPSIVQRLSTFSVPQTDRSLTGRAEYYTAATHIIRAHPIFGLGWGCYYDVDKILVNERYVKTPRPPGAPDATVHSAYLQLLVKTGALGMLGFLVILVAWVDQIWRTRKAKLHDASSYALFVGITAGVAGYLFHCTFENFFQWPVMAQSFWLLLGLSFLTAHWNETRESSYGPPTMLVGIAAALFLLFMYGSIRLETSNPYHFESNVAHAMAEGNIRKALNIARHATEVDRPSPMAYTVYGRVLLESGNANEALEQLTKAVGVRTEPPTYRETRKPYYFTPARLTLGKYCLEQDKLLDALVNFELARAYAVPADAEYGEFHAALYRAYSRQGLWARALEFGEPSDPELGDLDSRDIVLLARVCEGEQNWKLVNRFAERLLTREGLTAEAHYLLGRVDLAQERYEASLAHLEHAALSGHANAEFFYGTALEKNGQPARAIQAFLRTPSGDLYRPFALAKALMLLENLQENDRTLTTATKQELLGQLDDEFARMRLLKPPAQYDKDCRFRPVAVMASEAHFVSGGRFPILILWEDGQAPPADPARISFSSSGADDSLLLLRSANSVLQLQWVENLVNWESVERLPTGAGAIPGWIDTARDWFGLRSDNAARIEKAGDDNSFLRIARPTWCYSVPVRVRAGAGYLLAGRYKGPQGKGCLGWQSLDKEERVLFEENLLGQESSDTWTSHAGYMRSQPDWDTTRVQLDVLPHAGSVAFDNVMLVEIREPDPACSD